MREERNTIVTNLGTNGYFPVLRMDESDGDYVNVTQDAFDITEHINNAEIDLKMDEVRTMISTIVSIGKPNHAQHMLSEKLLLFSDQLKYSDLKHNDKMRQEFFKHKKLVSLGKLVPNIIRD
mmetsp:Transcript_13910/g.18980  ORF Transcript_13910/g.18980 Transcript_13910/m.18980 type:complete len:122 (-) Transcript_13910:2077-2442(-)